MNHEKLFEDLKRAVAVGRVAVVAGSGVSLQVTNNAPCASWTGLLKHGARHCDLEALLTPLIDTEDVDAMIGAAGLLSKKLGAPAGGEYTAWLRTAFNRKSFPIVHGELLDAIHGLGGIVATTNYDDLLTRDRGLTPVPWTKHAKVMDVLYGERPGVIHLHGYFDDPESVVLGVESYTNVTHSPHPQTVLRDLWTSKTLLFIGCGDDGLSDPNFSQLLAWATPTFKETPYRHFRLCRDSELNELNAQRPPDLRLFPLSYGASFEDLVPFLRSLGGGSGARAAAPAEQGRAERVTAPLIDRINLHKPFDNHGVPPGLRGDLQWAKGFVDDLRGEPPATLLVIGPEIDRCDPAGNVFDRLASLPPEAWTAAAIQTTGSSAGIVPLKFNLAKILRILVDRLRVVTVLNYSRLAAHAFDSWIEFRQEYEAARRTGRTAFVNCVVTESNIQDPQRFRHGYRPFIDWHAKILSNPEADRIIVAGFDIPQYAMRVAEWLQKDRGGMNPIMFLTRSTASARNPVGGENPFHALRVRLFDRFEDHVDGLLALAQIAWALDKEPDHSPSRAGWPNDLSQHLLTRYEAAMSRSCGGGSYKVVQQQIPVVAAGEEPFETILGAMTSKRSMERALLIAPAGAGKTTQTLFVAAEISRIMLKMLPVSDKHILEKGDPRWPLVEKIPIFITAQEIGSIIANHMSLRAEDRQLQPESYYLHIAKVLQLTEDHTNTLRELLLDGDVLFLIDSIDELDAVVHQSALTFVRTLLDEYPQCPALITSRVGEVVRAEWPGFVPLTLEFLNVALMRLYIEQRKLLSPDCPALQELLDSLDSDPITVLRQPMVLRLYCDALEALPPGASSGQLPSDRAGIYRRIMETIVDGNIRAAGIDERSPLARPEVHLRALGSLARTLLAENVIGAGHLQGWEKVAGGQHGEMTKTLRNALRDAASRYGTYDDEALARAVDTYLPLPGAPHSPQGILLFEYLYGNRVRFAHRSFQEFLAALWQHFKLSDESSPDTSGIRSLMEQLDELGDDREVSRFFAGLMLRGSTEWEIRHSQAIIRHRLRSDSSRDAAERQQDSTWVLRLLEDVGHGSGDSPHIVQHFFGHKMQREVRGIITEIGNGRKSEVPELLDVFFRARPRNSYLLYHAVEQLDAVTKTATTAQPRTAQYVKHARKILDDLWQESARRFGPSVPAVGLKAVADTWDGRGRVPAPNMIYIPEGEVVLSNDRTQRVPAFYAAETLVTRAQFALMTGQPIRHPDDLRMPYTNATWFDAMMFARWAFGQFGTLPTRTQWIRMARGSSRDEYAWGSASDAYTVNALANTAQRQTENVSTPVDAFKPQGAFGLYDLGGNLLEWTNTWFDPDETEPDGRTFETEPEHGYARLLMGGSYAHMIGKAKCPFPCPSSPENYVDVIGARIVVDEESYARWNDSASRS